VSLMVAIIVRTTAQSCSEQMANERGTPIAGGRQTDTEYEVYEASSGRQELNR
jgi:hypothetical protein